MLNWSVFVKGQFASTNLNSCFKVNPSGNNYKRAVFVKYDERAHFEYVLVITFINPYFVQWKGFWINFNWLGPLGLGLLGGRPIFCEGYATSTNFIIFAISYAHVGDLREGIWKSLCHEWMYLKQLRSMVMQGLFMLRFVGVKFLVDQTFFSIYKKSFDRFHGFLSNKWKFAEIKFSHFFDGWKSKLCKQ